AGDGITRIANHGADHAHEGDGGGDSPLYARLAYSTATAPLLDPGAWADPIDNSVVLLDETSRRSHRSGMRALGTKVIDDVALAASTAEAHWLVPGPEQINHGSGLTGAPERAGEITTVSLLRGEWEVRIIDVAKIDPAAHTLEAGGWPLADDAGVDARVTDESAVLESTELQAEIIGLLGWEAAGVSHHDDASPLGAHADVGTLMAAAAPGRYALPPRQHRPLGGSLVRAKAHGRGSDRALRPRTTTHARRRADNRAAECRDHEHQRRRYVGERSPHRGGVADRNQLVKRDRHVHHAR